MFSLFIFITFTNLGGIVSHLTKSSNDKVYISVKWSFQFWLSTANNIWRPFSTIKRQTVTKQTPWNKILLEKLRVTQLVKKFPTFLEPQGSLPHSQEPTINPYSKPNEPVHTFPHNFPKIHSNIVLPSMPGSSKWSLLCRFSIWNIICIPYLSHASCMHHSSHPPWRDHL